MTPPPRIISATDSERAMVELQRENEALAAMIAAMEERMPTREDMEYLRAAKTQSERASWLWKMVREYFPWVVSIGGSFVTFVWWAAHNVNIKGP